MSRRSVTTFAAPAPRNQFSKTNPSPSSFCNPPLAALCSFKPGTNPETETPNRNPETAPRSVSECRIQSQKPQNLYFPSPQPLPPQNRPSPARPRPTLNARSDMSDKNKNTRPGHSTGARSNHGKENSSLNATTHGLCCKKFFLIPGEKEEDFLAHAQRWFDSDAYKDQASPALEMLLQDLVEAHWLLNRASLRLFESESAFATAEINRDGTADEVFRRLRNIQRYKTSYENSFQKTLRAVEAFCKNRVAGKLTEARIEHVDASAYAVRMKTFQCFVKIHKFTPEEAWKAGKEVFRVEDLEDLKAPEDADPSSTAAPQADPLQ